ncbi:MAG: AAA family ATPase [Clostridia bacterium]|nr:AAA family ATPase [Clostridia bacterium]
MGIYLNPSKTAFQISVNSEIFVDKSEMLTHLNSVVNTQQRFVSVSRPRRFGKTMAADMVCAYYGREANSRDLFESCKLSSVATYTEGKRELAWDAYLGQFDVLRLVMTEFIEDAKNVSDFLVNLTEETVSELTAAYPDIPYGKTNKLRYVMNKVYAHTQRQFVVVIDEWDALFRVWKDDKEGQEKYLEFLRDLLKDKSYIALAYMTGILPIKKYGQHSALNMFTEYSMTFPRQLAPYTGFTEEEVAHLCRAYGRDFHAIKDWYDGYEVSDIIPPDPDHKEQKATGKPLTAKRYALYSPLSVVEAMTTGKIQDYWNKSETYEALAEYIRKDYDGLKDAVALLMDGGRLKIDTSTYQNDMTTFHGRDDVLSLLIHLGYLGYDDDSGEVFIPNKEILDEFKTSTQGNEWSDIFRTYEMSEQLLRATWNADASRVAELVEQAHHRAGNKTYHDEAALSYSIQLAYYAAHKYYTDIQELDTGKGYADIVYIPGPRYADKPVLLIELKYNQDASTAIDQIRRQKYPERLKHYQGNILLIGINYDRDVPSTDASFKHHTCVIERA